MNTMRDAIDIVIPIYNGYDDVQLCMESVRKYTDLTKHYVLLINDCSPDGRIRPYLDSQAEEHIIVMHNEKNQGFSANVNKGMMYSDRDVILLNSDTIVTKNWVEKILRCAYASKSTGTVTPLSNSATLCSVPIMCQDNPVPENVTIDEYAEIIERCSLRRYPRITVAMGFCMFIKQHVIEETGLFDAATFERGYGEENDFCNRAEQLGYRHVMCDDTFIYHKGTASFDTKEKMALCEAHDKILNERYPVQMWKNHLYCMNNPDQEIRDNINFYTNLFTGHKNILYLLHLDFQEDAFNCIGGIQLHVKDLMEKLKDEYNIFVAARDKNDLRVTAYTKLGVQKLKFEIGAAPDFPVFYDENLKHIFEQVIEAFKIDLVHVHHTQDLSLEAYYVAKERNIPLLCTIHDYYYICPTIKLLTEKNEACQLVNKNCSEEEMKSLCENCLHGQCGMALETKGYLKKWQNENRKALALCDKIIYPSQTAMDLTLEYYPELKEKSMVIAHGTDALERTALKIEAPKQVIVNKQMKVRLDCALGEGNHLNDIRGWAYIEDVDSSKLQAMVEIKDCRGKTIVMRAQKVARPDVATAYKRPEAVWCGFSLLSIAPKLSAGNCKIRVMLSDGENCYTDGNVAKAYYRGRIGKEGRLNVGFLGGMVPAKGSEMAKKLIVGEKEKVNWFVFGAVGDKELHDMQQENLFFSDVYQKENIFHMLKENHIDIVCILPTWAETFCYTVSESWLSGIPVLGTDIGAVGERIKESGGGWVVPVDASAEVVLEKILYLESHKDEIKEKAELVKQMSVKTIPQMAEDYAKLYAQEMKKSGGKAAEEDSICVDNEFIFQALALANDDIGGNGQYGRLNRLKKENDMLKGNMEMLKNTKSYKLARKISEANIPFKEQLKKRLKR